MGLCKPVMGAWYTYIGHVCVGVRISAFAPQLCNTSVPDLDEYADGYRIKKEQVGTPFGLVGALEGGFGGLGPSGPKISKHRSLLLSRTNNTSTSCLACTLPFFALTSKP